MSGSRINYVRTIFKENVEIHDPETGKTLVVSTAGWRVGNFGEYVTCSSPTLSVDDRLNLSRVLRDQAWKCLEWQVA